MFGFRNERTEVVFTHLDPTVLISFCLQQRCFSFCEIIASPKLKRMLGQGKQALLMSRHLLFGLARAVDSFVVSENREMTFQRC
jgi:hypothetical protein